jgi:hypothetical protein
LHYKYEEEQIVEINGRYPFCSHQYPFCSCNSIKGLELRNVFAFKKLQRYGMKNVVEKKRQNAGFIFDNSLQNVG